MACAGTEMVLLRMTEEGTAIRKVQSRLGEARGGGAQRQLSAGEGQKKVPMFQRLCV